ncbi:MAG: hypothetical protein KGK02_04535 [Rhodospirillales bacterium]|nr:hypothetical protein [Rhodospirillales bacterium]
MPNSKINTEAAGQPIKKPFLTPGEELFLTTAGKYQVSAIWPHAISLEEYILADSRMASIRREVLKNSGRQRRYMFGIKNVRDVYRSIAKANRLRAKSEDVEEQDFWTHLARHYEAVAALSNDDLAIYSTLHSVRLSYGSSAELRRDFLKWPLALRKRLRLLGNNGGIQRDRGNCEIIGFCVGMAQHFADLFGYSKDDERDHQVITMDGTIAILCDILFGTAPSRVAIHKMTAHVKPSKNKTITYCLS